MSTRHLLFIAILLARDASFSLGFKIPAESKAELPPRIRPDILQNSRERAYNTGGGIPIESRDRTGTGRHRKNEDKPYNPKENDSRYKDPKYWNGVQEKLQQGRESKRQSVSSRQKEGSVGIVWKTVAIILAVICSPALFPVVLLTVCMLPFIALEILLRCAPWAIAGFALYKSVELLVEGNYAPLFEKDENSNEMDNMNFNIHETDDKTDDSEHMAFQQ